MIHAFDLVGDTLEHNLGTNDYLVQIYEVDTGVIVDFRWLRVYRGPDSITWWYYQQRAGFGPDTSGWRPYIMPAGRYRAVLCVQDGPH